METHSKVFFSNTVQRSTGVESDLILICDNFSTPENIGSIVRLAVNANAAKLIIIGSEGCRQSKVKKTAGAALAYIPVEHISVEELMEAIPTGFTTIALETTAGAKELYGGILPQKLALVLGNEKYGVSEEVLRQCNASVYIPMIGPIKSMNVSHAASVCVFEWLRQNLVS